jgi:hypothetical protein
LYCLPLLHTGDYEDLWIYNSDRVVEANWLFLILGKHEGSLRKTFSRILPVFNNNRKERLARVGKVLNSEVPRSFGVCSIQVLSCVFSSIHQAPRVEKEAKFMVNGASFSVFGAKVM